ncbi:hypothetical protein GBA63_19670 [Rubrobacter tropicus]|uniref:Uncharacterized protein n=1 Tax=Rubrobacter tropicus TaxID=2653851 RepID=A0A6G8QDR7_9ACTN|nr:hypothetical protein [Rubrobacter tropicus]QIN84619.1 hypothetical protein GBA63_19670 [Rubrobacter tropicus]
MSGLPQGGFRQRGQSGRRRILVACGVLFLLLLAWSYAVLSYGGRGESGGSAPSEARTVPSDNGASEATGNAPETGREAVPDDTAYVEDGAGGRPDGDVAGGARPEQDPAAGVADPSRTGTEEGSSEPEGYRPDPLGTGASAGDLAPTDEERVRFAAARFVTAAYGYSGDDEDAYNQGVGSTVAWPVFYESPGSKEIERYAAQVGESGTRSAALLSRFELTRSGGPTASGYAHFETGEGYGPDGGLTGRKLSYRQKMTLVRSGGDWVVKHTDEIEET